MNFCIVTKSGDLELVSDWEIQPQLNEEYEKNLSQIWEVLNVDDIVRGLIENWDSKNGRDYEYEEKNSPDDFKEDAGIDKQFGIFTKLGKNSQIYIDTCKENQPNSQVGMHSREKNQD